MLTRAPRLLRKATSLSKAACTLLLTITSESNATYTQRPHSLTSSHSGSGTPPFCQHHTPCNATGQRSRLTRQSPFFTPSTIHRGTEASFTRSDWLGWTSSRRGDLAGVSYFTALPSISRGASGLIWYVVSSPVGEYMGITRAGASRWEGGKPSLPSSALLLAV